MFNGREYSLVRIWWRPNCKLTNGRRPSKETLCISGLLYFLPPWLRCLLLVRSNRFKTFTDWHPGLVRFPMLSMWSLQPYGAAVPSCRIQCSSRLRRKGVLKLGLFVGWYIFSRIRTFIERTEWSGRLKCLYSNWLPPVLIEDRCPFILFLNSPLVSPTYINPQRAHSIAYTRLQDLQDRSSKLCVENDRLVRLLEKELSVIRILQVLQFLVPHLDIVQSFGTNLWSLRTSRIFTLHGLISMNLSAFRYHSVLSSLTT